MKKYYIYLPEGIRYLEDYKELESKIYQYGTCILNKYVTGCGATSMYLADPLPTILCSPRKALMYSKAKSKRFKGRIYLFRNEKDPDNASVIDLENRMMAYILDCDRNRVAPKILVSYDSFKHVAQRLLEDRSLGRYQIIVDEFQALFTDSEFKGGVDIEFLENLQMIDNRIIYMSATPYLETYLNQLPEFQSLPYVELKWPPSSLSATNIVMKEYDNGRLGATIKNIIQKYRDEGYFEEKIHQGQRVFAREALFFMNNVRAISGIVTANGLTPEDTTIICAYTDKNKTALKKIGFEISEPPQEDEPRKPFTFITKCSFEGADFYSQAYTYIFSNVTIKSMAVDISLDLKQIMGRQRDDSNPFKYDATFFYKTDPALASKSEDEFQDYIAKKERVSRKWIDNYNASDPELQENLASGKRDQQEKRNFSEDYVATVDDAGSTRPRIVFNSLAMCNDIRAWDLRKTTYFSGCQVLRAVNDVSEPDRGYPLTATFLDRFKGDFENRMKVYCEFLDVHPEYLEKLESLPQIPMSIKEYYRVCGPAELRAASYVESNIRIRMGMAARAPELEAAMRASFESGKFYSKPEVKAIIQSIYDALGFPLTAKATDLERQAFMSYSRQTRTIDGKRVEGYMVD